MLPEFSSYQVSQMTRLVILSKKGSALSSELKNLFSLVIPEVVVKDSIASDDRFLIDLSLLDNEPGSESAEINFKMLHHARQFANEEKGESMYVFVGKANFMNEKVPEQAGYLGLAKTADLEWSNTTVRAIGFENVESTNEVAQSIFDEVLKGGMTNEVFYSQSFERSELSLEEKRGEHTEFAPKPNATLVVTGGGRGVTADCIIELSRKAPFSFVILGRTALKEESPSTATVHEKDLKGHLVKADQAEGKKIDLQEVSRKANQIIANREIISTLGKLEELGSQTSYYAVDVTDQGALNQTIQEVVSRYGSIEGIIHGAGVLADKYIKDKTEAQFLRVFETKVKGFKNLLEATKDQPLTHICCFTSVAGRFGNTGQSDYAMANEVLNKWCIQQQEQRGASCNVKALNWGPWEGGMVTPEIKANFEKMGVRIIPRKQGAQAFVKEMETKGSEVEVVVGDGLHHWKRQTPKQKTFSSWIHEETFPILNHHKIKGTVVVPMAGIISQMMAIGNYFFDDKKITVQDVQVLNGVKVPQFYEEGKWLTYQITPGEDQLHVEIFSSESNIPHYTLSIHNNGYQALNLEGLTSSVGSAPKSELLAHQGYFHGEPLQAITSLEAINEGGSDYAVEPIKEKDFRMRLMDGAYQAACVQAGYMLDVSYVIPMGCRTFHWFKMPGVDADLQYKLRVTDQNDLEFTSDIQLVERQTQEVYFETRDALAITYQPEPVK